MRVLLPISTRFLTIAVILGSLLCGATTTANAQFYALTVLTADQTGVGLNTDPNLINPWGTSFSPTGPFWASDNGTGVSTLYDGSGVPQSLVVTIPPAHGTGKGRPTGTVFNGTTDFVVTQ